MGLFDIFKKKNTQAVYEPESVKEESPVNEPENIPEKETCEDDKAAAEEMRNDADTQSKDIVQQMKEMTEVMAGPTLVSVFDVDELPDTDDVMVIGSLRGTINKGNKIAISHPGTTNEVLGSETVLAVGLEEGYVDYASNAHVVLRIENAKKYSIRAGFVLHSQEAGSTEIHNAYIAALGDTYVSRKDLQIEEDEFEKLTLTDCAEIFRLYTWFHGKALQSGEPEIRKILQEKLQKFTEGMADKLKAEEVIYCPYSRITNAPYFFSRLAKQGEDKYACSPPSVLIFTKAYYESMASQFDEERFEIKEIVNTDQKGISRFIREVICNDGATGICVLSEQTGIAANLLVTPQELKATTEYATYSNPAVQRYILLLEQIGKPNTPDEEISYKLFYGYLAQELRKAKLLVPYRAGKKLPQPVKEGKMPLGKDTKVAFSTIQGKGGSTAVCMYTDRSRLKDAQGSEYMLCSVAGLIGTFDCVINLTAEGKSGCYVNKEMFEDMKKYE